MGVIDGLPADEVAAVLRAWLEVVRYERDKLERLTFEALAAHQYDVALETAQAAMRQRPDANALSTLAEVFYYRGEREPAVHFGARAAALAPHNLWLGTNVERYRLANGDPAPRVEAIRREGRFWLPRFYGEDE